MPRSSSFIPPALSTAGGIRSCWRMALLFVLAGLCAGSLSACAPSDAPDQTDEKALTGPIALRELKAFIDENLASGRINKSFDAHIWKANLPAPPVVKFDPKESYYWNLETNKGVLKIKLLPEAAPYHVAVAIYLTLVGFYDDCHFLRMVQGFVAQAGSNGMRRTGHAGFEFEAELVDGLSHDRKGVVSAANRQKPKTDSSQFFITLGPAPGLDGKHTIYGEVSEGFQTLNAFESFAVTPGQDAIGRGQPLEPIYIQRATITVE